MLDLFLTFLKIGTFTFGGGYVMLPLMEEYCVDKKKWLSHDEFMNTVVISQSTPGPIAINLATYCGYVRYGILGGVVATLGVVIPSIVVIYIISLFLEDMLKNEIVNFAFIGIRIGVSLIIINTAINMLQKEISNNKRKNAELIILFLISTGS